jgi:class 3 adenylate cyclase
MSSVAETRVEAARDAVRERAWEKAYELLSEANRAGELEPTDFLLLAEAAAWSGHMEARPPALEQAYSALLEAGENARAAYVAVELAHDFANQMQPAVAGGWLSRARRLLEEQPEAAEHGYLALEEALRAHASHEFDEAIEFGRRAEELGRRFGDRGLEVRGMQRRGTALIAQGNVATGRSLLDEAAAAALAGELDPRSTIVVYCNTIGACRDIADFDRAGEWTDHAHEFCTSSSLSAFPGMCRVNYAEIMKVKGRLAEAGDEAIRAGEELRSWLPRVAGAAFYELGEIRLRLGDLAQAEQSFREADEYGRDPQPGLSLLRLAKGNAKGAWSSLRRALADDGLTAPARVRLLPAGIEVALAVGELDAAEAYAEELAEEAERFAASVLRAQAAYARGAVALARGNAAAAFGALREARRLWEATGATYDVGRTRELLGLAARADGDEETATWELQAAAARFERLGAVRDAERIGAHLAADDLREVTKTFLFTDIVRSTELLETIEDRHWANVLRRHDDTLRTIFADYGGQVVDHTGDGFFVAFDEAALAVQAAVAVQRAVDQEFVFDVRIGLHTDGALARGENYHGRGVHTAARVGAAAGGREILATEESVAGLEIDVSEPRPLELKGLKAPVSTVAIAW